MLKLGSHVSMQGDAMLIGSVEEALSYDATAFMIYTGAPQNTRRRALEQLRIEAAQQRMAEQGLPLGNIVVHAPYIINLANPDPEKRRFAIEFLVSEIERTAAIGAEHIVLHPGAHVGQGADVGIAYIAESLDDVFAKTQGVQVRVALETMAGKGTEIGRNFEELRAIMDCVKAPERLSVCFDTCHTHDAGYDIKDDFDGVMQQFDDVIGVERIGVFHINDSKNPQGASKDRHENLGLGHIGFPALSHIVHHPDFAHIPKILETPYVTEDDASKARLYPPYKYEIAMLKANTFDPSFIARIRIDQRK
ncbi:MAG: deoxyribonuclease IV [Acholeplasmatales bacterium]|nr:MAG: deoxyribonuclease IV [Acholeplasmatales bacterium]